MILIAGVETSLHGDPDLAIVLGDDLGSSVDDVIVRHHVPGIRDQETGAGRFLAIAQGNDELEDRRFNLTLQLGSRDERQVEKEC